MRNIILDTNVISEIMRETPQPQVLAWFSRQEIAALYLTSITDSELWHGVERLKPSHPKRRGLLTKLEIVENQFKQRILSFDAAAARLWGSLKGRYGRERRVFPDIDLQIAAIALRDGMSIATANAKDFSGLGIELINPFSRAESARRRCASG
jgi:predicted nucleic acid-binding protein